MNRLLVALGAALVVAGLLWPWLKRTHLFHLPGDIVIDRPGVQVLFPDHDDADRQRGCFADRVVDAAVENAWSNRGSGRVPLSRFRSR
jgi:hypothetical protein